MNVLSLFNGMGCIWLALDRLGVKVNKRYCSEIDKYANIVNDANYPDSIHLGDVRNVKASKVDLFVGGSPCQGFSFAGKMLNFSDPRSALFFEYVRLLNEARELNPNLIFLLENVRMKREHEMVISKYLGVEPILINSARVSAQNRERLYWTNINAKVFNLFGDKRPDIKQPKDRGILLKDILQPENEILPKYYLSELKQERLSKVVSSTTEGLLKLDVHGVVKPNQQKASCYTAGGHSAGNHSDMDVLCVAMRGRYEDGKVVQKLEPRNDGKTNTITKVSKDNFINQRGRGFNKGGEHHEKSPTVSSHSWQNNHSVSNYRRLTPIEVERLFNIPDNYTAHVSDSQRYKMLGNGWEIETITHILKHAF